MRTETHIEVPDGVFPEELTRDVYRLGYNSPASYGAHSFLIRRKNGNAMVDSPRFTRQVVAKLEQWGGLHGIFLSHRDDVADAERYARHFGARVWIHKADRSAAKFATDILEGEEPARIGDDLIAIPVPGHTKGSVVYLYDNRCLFTGDSLAWSFEEDDLVAYHDYCWYSWAAQTKSLRRLLDYRFEWVLAGHGGAKGLSESEMHARLAALVERMEKD